MSLAFVYPYVWDRSSRSKIQQNRMFFFLLFQMFSDSCLHRLFLQLALSFSFLWRNWWHKLNIFEMVGNIDLKDRLCIEYFLRYTAPPSISSLIVNVHSIIESRTDIIDNWNSAWLCQVLNFTIQKDYFCSLFSLFYVAFIQKCELEKF